MTGSTRQLTLTPAGPEAMLEPVAWRWRWGKLGYTAWHLSEERPAFPEDGYECEPLYAALTTSAEHVRETPGSEHEALAVTKAHLREHWLASIVCDHEAKTDVAVCSCSQWKDEPHPSVGAAVDAWIDHVFDALPARRSPQTPLVGAVPMEAVGWQGAYDLAVEWSKADVMQLHGGEMTTQERRTVRAMMLGLASQFKDRIRALKASP